MVTLLAAALLASPMAGGDDGAAGGTAAAPGPAPAAQEDQRDYTQISLEELLNRHISVAATKTRVDVARAPVSVTVITPEDIRRSGATRLADVLRTVPGLDVLEAFPGYISVSARGTSEAFVNNMLVLIDGRRLEVQLSGTPFLEEAPVRLVDIKRIEVVKGPVGAIYGTNALAGLISITTYSPDEVIGTLVLLGGGDRDTYGGTVRHAGRLGEQGWSYKAVGGFSYTGTWGSMDEGYAQPAVALRKADALLRLEKDLGRERRFTVEAGASLGDLASLTIVTNQTQDFAYPHLRMGYDQPDLHALLTYSPQSLELRERVPPVQPLVDKWSHAVNLSLDRTLRPFSTSTVTLGGNARFQHSTFTSIATPHSQVVGSIFLQDEQVVVKDRLVLFGALGASWHPEIPTQLDANAAAIFTPHYNHALRVSFGRAHRDPAFLENFINFRRRFGTQEGYQSSNPDLRPEAVEALEAGYHGRFDLGTVKAQVFASAFTEDLRDLISIVTRNVAPGTLPEHPTVTVLQQFRNVEDRKGEGFEVGLELDRALFRFATHYSYQRFENAGTGAEILRNVPRHKFAAGLHGTIGVVDGGVWVLSTSRTVQESGYLLVNPRLGVRSGAWEFSVQCFNALDDKHIETANDRGILGEVVGRSITASITVFPQGK